MSPLEIFATLITILSVFLAVKLKIAQYPIGIIGTILFFFVFWNANLYFSAALQVFFTFVQIYGWWYWTCGDNGKRPKVTYEPWKRFWTVFVLGSCGFAATASYVAATTSAAVPLADAFIFGASVIAQWYLDRKRMQTWLVWGVVNVASIYVYSSQGLLLTTGTYVLLLLNTFWGYSSWKKAYNAQTV